MTTFQQSIANDFALVCDNLEPITLTLNRNVPEVVTIANANRSMLKKSNNVFSGLNIEEGDLMFQFPVNEFNPTINPADVKQRDSIKDDDGNTYIVQGSQLAVLQTVWWVAARLK